MYACVRACMCVCVCVCVASLDHCNKVVHADSLQSRLEFLWLSFFTFWSNSRREAGPCQSQGHLTTERRNVSTSERGWKFTCETGMSVAISRYLIYHHMKMHSCMRAHTYTQTRESVAQNRNTRS